MGNGLGATFQQTVEEGTYRLHRSWPSLLATGAVGGIDVSIGVLAMLLVMHGTGDRLLAALAFGIGFVALTMAGSELFTENFLVPISAVITAKARMSRVVRLWVGTAVANLVGGGVMIVIVLAGVPELGDAAVDKGMVYVERGVSIEAFASAVLAGIVITLMTWMQHASGGLRGKLVAAVAAAFLLSYGHLSHVIVASLEVFAAVLEGSSVGPGSWLAMFGLWAAGNAVGGIGLVTALRLIQVGPRRVQHERERSIAETDETMADVDATDSPDAAG